MLESPIHQYTTDIQTKIENDIRDQYNKGYIDGYRDALECIRHALDNMGLTLNVIVNC